MLCAFPAYPDWLAGQGEAYLALSLNGGGDFSASPFRLPVRDPLVLLEATLEQLVGTQGLLLTVVASGLAEAGADIGCLVKPAAGLGEEWAFPAQSRNQTQVTCVDVEGRLALLRGVEARLSLYTPTSGVVSLPRSVKELPAPAAERAASPEET